MTATLERTPRTTDARITGGRSEVVHTRVNATDDPIAHLTPDDLSLIHISEPTRPCGTSRMPSSS